MSEEGRDPQSPVSDEFRKFITTHVLHFNVHPEQMDGCMCVFSSYEEKLYPSKEQHPIPATTAAFVAPPL